MSDPGTPAAEFDAAAADYDRQLDLAAQNGITTVIASGNNYANFATPGSASARASSSS